MRRRLYLSAFLFIFVCTSLRLDVAFARYRGAGVVVSEPLPKVEESSADTSSDLATSPLKPTKMIDYSRSHSQQLEEQTAISEFFFRDGMVLTNGTFIEIVQSNHLK